MEFQDVVDRRRMVRNYAETAVDPAVVERILSNALHSPSAGFSQGWAFLLLDRPDDVSRFWECATPPAAGDDSWSRGMRRAPVVIVPLSCKRIYLDRYAEADKGWTDRDENRWPVPYWHIDAGMASLLMLQTVTDEGLGACFFGIPPSNTAAFRAAFDVPEDYTPIGAITIGHREEDRRSPSLTRGRRDLATTVRHGSWTHPYGG